MFDGEHRVTAGVVPMTAFPTPDWPVVFGAGSGQKLAARRARLAHGVSHWYPLIPLSTVGRGPSTRHACRRRGGIWRVLEGKYGGPPARCRGRARGQPRAPGGSGCVIGLGCILGGSTAVGGLRAHTGWASTVSRSPSLRASDTSSRTAAGGRAVWGAIASDTVRAPPSGRWPAAYTLVSRAFPPGVAPVSQPALWERYRRWGETLGADATAGRAAAGTVAWSRLWAAHRPALAAAPRARRSAGRRARSR